MCIRDRYSGSTQGWGSCSRSSILRAPTRIYKTISATGRDGFVFEGKDDFLEKLLSIPQEVADFSEEERFFGERIGSCSFLFFLVFFGAEAVELFDKEENGECGDDKADDIGEEEACLLYTSRCV